MGQLYAPNPNLWVIERGDAAVYILGTEHLLPTDFGWRSAAIDTAIARSSALLTETGAVENGPGNLSDTGAASIVTGAPLASRLKGRRRVKWEGMAAILPLPIVSHLDGLPTWMAAEAINLLNEQRFGVPRGWGADRQLVELFKAAKKPIGAIERIKVADYARVVDERARRRMLATAIDAAGSPGPWQAALLRYHSWARGGIDPLGLDAALQRRTTLTALVDGMAAKRNAEWATRIAALLRQSDVTFVAVGAAHLYGPFSLFHHLRKTGVRERLISSPTAAPITVPLTYRPTSWKDCDHFLVPESR